MSIAGIAKEVTTISISAAIFGDALTPLNITGVGITVCGIVIIDLLPFTTNSWILSILGIALFTYHKYRKSLETAVPLDAHGNPISIEHSVTGSADGRTSSHVELDETARLTRGSDEFDGVRLAP
jgi:solute carrier family 35 protein C2